MVKQIVCRTCRKSRTTQQLVDDCPRMVVSHKKTVLYTGHVFSVNSNKMNHQNSVIFENNIYSAKKTKADFSSR